MTPEQIDRVFGRGRLKMVTGEHVEVFREAVAPGERRRYTKRFLNTREGDFGQWTEREWRILARLIGHGITCVPEVVQFDRGRIGGMRIVQTYDAGVTVDQWATLLPVIRDDRVHRHVFEDCAHWWALAHHCLRALDEIHRLELVHLDVKGDNVCIPYAPANFDPETPDPELKPVFAHFALIDFAFALVSKESLTTPLPIGWQKEYDYQSPRLLAALERGREGDLQPTRELDWRCDMYSLAAMLKRYLPDAVEPVARGAGWTAERYDAAKSLILRIREAHDTDPALPRPHAELIEATGARLDEGELSSSLERGWSLARELNGSAAYGAPLTPVTQVAPVTRIATPIQVTRSGRTAVTVIAPPVIASPVIAEAPRIVAATQPAGRVAPPRRARALVAAFPVGALVAIGATLWYANEDASKDAVEKLVAPVRGATESAIDTATRLAHRDARRVAAADERSASPVPVAQASAAPPRQANASATQNAAAESARRDARQDRATAPSHVLPDSSALSTAAPLVPAPTVPAQERAAARPPSYRGSMKSPEKPLKSNPRMSASATSARVAASVQPAPRPHAPWASLQPPSWVTSRAHSPGYPPGYKAPEHEAPIAMPSLASKETLSEPQAATQIAPAAAAPIVRAAAQVAAAEPATEPTHKTQPASQISANEERRPDPLSLFDRSWLASRSAAPVEDRSVLPGRPAEASVRSSADPPPGDRTAEAQRMLSDAVPRVARQGETEVSRVLLIAASAYRPAQDKSLADAARLARIRDETVLSSRSSAPEEARRLHGQARSALASNRNVRRALDLELRAFAADPRDPEIAGGLAALYLKDTPSQPERARQLALVALTARSPTFATTRLEDWQTFAVASALSGHEADARNALYVTLALSANIERICVYGWDTLSSYGEPMRRPVEALLYRVHMRGRSVDSPWCAWPPDWSAPPRLAGELH
ncbi:MAG TPA: hypothetical protein VL742_07905 [Casimicrobiaceae bacterium]|nr:hypothetical protein [Casimicrobiaceae bacterium]